jgi:hypothetical protein
MIAPPVMEALKAFNGYYTDDDMRLDAYTPYGNLTLTYMEIVINIDLVNEEVVSIYKAFNDHKQKSLKGPVISNPQDSFRYRFQMEQVIYWLRKIADQLISMLYILRQKQETGDYPKQILVASIGKLLSMKEDEKEELKVHFKLLKILNEIFNAYKHTLVNAQLHGHRGLNEPVVFALAAQNMSSKQPNFHVVGFKSILDNYNLFLTDVKVILFRDHQVL